MRLTLICFLIFLFACQNNDAYLPKPRVYPRIIFPERDIILFERKNCPFAFEQASYFMYNQDKLRSADVIDGSDCWFDLDVAELNASYHISYIAINTKAHFDALVEDAFEMVDKHNVKANYRDERLISRPEQNVYGLLFEIDGPVAAPLQFYLTDSTRHFLRGSLYFNAQVNRDSVAPVYSFLKEDFTRMAESFRWLQ